MDASDIQARVLDILSKRPASGALLYDLVAATPNDIDRALEPLVTAGAVSVGYAQTNPPMKLYRIAAS